MLRHMYNLPYSRLLETKDENSMFEFHIKVFMLADKYDCPSLRSVAMPNFRRCADNFINGWSSKDSPDAPTLYKAIANLCGPPARLTADLSLRHEALKFCAENYNKLFSWPMFRQHVVDGALFDTDAMKKLLVIMGQLALEKDSSHASSSPVHDDAWKTSRNPPLLEPGSMYILD